VQALLRPPGLRSAGTASFKRTSQRTALAGCFCLAIFWQQAYNDSMAQAQETILDFDNSVGTEDRFAIRHFIADFVDAVNTQPKAEVARFIDEGATAEGFDDFVIQQPQIVEMFYKKFFGRRHNYIHFPKLKLTSTKHFFYLNGSYEEYQEGILSAVGTIELALIKRDEDYHFVKLKFFPRMRAASE
jgi:hypothetical protein